MGEGKSQERGAVFRPTTNIRVKSTWFKVTTPLRGTLHTYRFDGDKLVLVESKKIG